MLGLGIDWAQQRRGRTHVKHSIYTRETLVNSRCLHEKDNLPVKIYFHANLQSAWKYIFHVKIVRVWKNDNIIGCAAVFDRYLKPKRKTKKGGLNLNNHWKLICQASMWKFKSLDRNIDNPDPRTKEFLDCWEIPYIWNKWVVICRIFFKNGQNVALSQKGTITVPTARQFIRCLRTLGMRKRGEHL